MNWSRLKLATDGSPQAPADIPTVTQHQLTQEELDRLRALQGGGMARLLGGATAEQWLAKFITVDPEMLRMKQCVIRLLRRDEPVLITGPTGTGKELLAQALGGARWGGRLVPVNCGGLTPTLVASTFFGSVKGAYTGAVTDRPGVLQQAGEGTVFLDEIAELPLELQAMLLRAIQEGCVTRVGAVTEERISCRFVAATKYDLRKRVTDGLFREDLFARLMTFEIRTTALMARQHDITPIAQALSGDPDFVLPDSALPDIWQFNCRAIQTCIARMAVDPEYYGLA